MLDMRLMTLVAALCLGLQLFGQEIALPDTLRTKGSLADTVQLSGASVTPQEAFYHQPPYGGVVSINI